MRVSHRVPNLPSAGAAGPAASVDVFDGTHHDGSQLFVPEQPLHLDDTVPVFVRVPRARGRYPVRSVALRTVYDGEPRYVPAVVDRVGKDETWYRADLLAHNPVTSYRFLLDHGSSGYSWLNGSGVHDRDVTDAHDFRVTTAAPPPAWTRDSVVYQIFLDRFATSGPKETPEWAVPAAWDDPVVSEGPATPLQFYGGDLRGIVERLDHLQRLGVDLLYLTPFFPAESNHRYNASSFDRVDPLLGGDAALAELTDAAHARGMRVMGDLTTNHSGSEHEWFRRACADPSAAERSFYYFQDHPETYTAWLGERTLPKLNWADPELRRRLVEGPNSVVARLLRPPYGLDAWRVDVANMTGRHGADDYNAEVAALLRATMTEVNPETYLLGEHNHDACADMTGFGWQGTMNYVGFTRPVWSWLSAPGNDVGFFGRPVPVPTVDARRAVATMRDFAAGVPWTTTTHNVNLLSSHDTARIRTVTASAEKVDVAAGLLLTSPGIPMLFMGDEWGLTGTTGEDSRKPMPWNRPELWDKDTFETFRSLIAVRRASDALRHGGLRWVHAGGEAMVFLRETADERVLVLLSRGPHAGVRLPLPVVGPVRQGVNVYGGMPLDLRWHGVCLPGDGPTVQVWRLLDA